jgi:TRAP-type C4-dicarboxylate transport system permease small subunit
MLESAIRRTEQVSMGLSVLCVVALMLIVCCDAATRYLFNAPLPWASDVVTHYLLISAIYFAVSSTFKHGDHINIDLVHAKLPPAARAWVDALVTLVAACLFSIIAYAAWSHSMEALAKREFYPGYTQWPVWLSYLPIAVGSALLVLRLVHHAAVLIRRGGDPEVRLHSEVHAE